MALLSIRMRCAGAMAETDLVADLDRKVIFRRGAHIHLNFDVGGTMNVPVKLGLGLEGLTVRSPGPRRDRSDLALRHRSPRRLTLRRESVPIAGACCIGLV